MWINKIENKQTINSIYKDQIPSLINLVLHEILITTGVNFIVTMRIDTTELPKSPPLKWIQNEANTAQLVFDFIDSKIIRLTIDKSDYISCSLVIVNENEFKRIILFDKHKTPFIELQTKWVFIKSITGYKNLSCL